MNSPVSSYQIILKTSHIFLTFGETWRRKYKKIENKIVETYQSTLFSQKNFNYCIFLFVSLPKDTKWYYFCYCYNDSSWMLY